MTKIQLHILTPYSFSNLNRDDLGKIKTGNIGNTQRLRISSQSLKRCWRFSESYQECIDRSLQALRTRQIGAYIYNSLVTGNRLVDLIDGKESEMKNRKLDQAQATSITENLVLFLGKQVGGKDSENTEAEGNEDGMGKSKAEKNKKGSETNEPEDIAKKFNMKELCVLSRDELDRLDACLKRLTDGDKPLLDFITRGPSNKTNPATIRSFRNNFQKLSGIFSHNPSSADVGMFGRMLASNPAYTIEGAVQVAHAFTVHKSPVESDFFTAVDDLNSADDSGSAHLDETEFGAGLYYLYVVIDRDLLKKNLGGNEETTRQTLEALTKAALTVSPTGKQSSFASRAYASYALAEKGSQTPFSLSAAYLTAIRGENILENAISRLNETLENFEKVYGKIYDEKMEINAYKGTGSFASLVKFVSE